MKANESLPNKKFCETTSIEAQQEIQLPHCAIANQKMFSLVGYLRPSGADPDSDPLRLECRVRISFVRKAGSTSVSK